MPLEDMHQLPPEPVALSVNLASLACKQSPQEALQIEKTCASFRQYACFQRTARSGQAHRISVLADSAFPPALRGGTDEFAMRNRQMIDAEIRNQFFFDSVLLSMGVPNSQDPAVSGEGVVDSSYAEKVKSVLKSIARDWTATGAEERSESYGPMIEGVTKYVKRGGRVLVPGAGLGRLALEIYQQGYEVQGNEFTYHMLFISDFILNRCGIAADHSFRISPFLGATCNVLKVEDMTRTAIVPDIDPQAALQKQPEEVRALNLEFSMSAGEFCAVYGKQEEAGAWDAVASCFFLDTAPNLVEYFRVIHRCLSEDGILINFGPLLYHWSGPVLRPGETLEMYYEHNKHMDARYMSSVDLCWDDIKQIMINVGFEILEERTGINAAYTKDEKSLMH
eukprot:CAMPEP_0194334522 /NCGR_PEP_ID=MMETSP0171-20130528/66370_1 /TAXON_ID=218684 /ORGANISM="Corethron pennatum, Strain L29A3" /LENGTH=393 /DNA_ID=CAMNT_0039097205 /DNA_START=65 /DNA_END=1243 /DNA_ORIENTATION=+